MKILHFNFYVILKKNSANKRGISLSISSKQTILYELSACIYNTRLIYYLSIKIRIYKHEDLWTWAMIKNKFLYRKFYCNNPKKTFWNKKINMINKIAARLFVRRSLPFMCYHSYIYMSVYARHFSSIKGIAILNSTSYDNTIFLYFAEYLLEVVYKWKIFWHWQGTTKQQNISFRV